MVQYNQMKIDNATNFQFSIEKNIEGTINFQLLKICIEL